MSDTFRALWATREGERQQIELREISEADLPDGDVTLAVEYSTLNYKDGLALTGKAPILRTYPMVPGIDIAGTVTGSHNPDFQPGDRVVLNGYGVGEVHSGGYAERARVKGAWLVKLPDGISTAQAAAIGTAGYTAMLSVLALERHGLTPGHGDILVTGAAGGVGSVALALLNGLGYRAVAASRRAATEGEYLRQLGAADVIDAADIAEPTKPLAKERWAGAIDSVGSRTLAAILTQIRYHGAVAACGLARGSDLPTTVMPFILRGIALLGIDSVNAPHALRQEAWSRLARDLDFGLLDSTVSHAHLEDLPRLAGEIVEGKVRGRVVVDL